MDVTFKVEGKTLRGVLAKARRPFAAALLVHGFNSTRDEFGDAPMRLAQAGITCLAFDQRGFGGSEGDPGLTSPEMALADIRGAARLMRRDNKAPLVLLGHSLGASYALYAASRMDVAAVVAAHPVHKIIEETDPLSRAIYHLAGRRASRRQAKGKSVGRLPYFMPARKLFVSKEAQRAAGRPDFLRKDIHLGNYPMAVAMDGIGWAAAVQVPTLVVVSPFDKTVAPAHSEAVGLAVRDVAWLEHKGGHSCFRDLDGAFVADGIAAWLRSVLR